ncbi:fibronectin type III domain-containing protein 7-like [Genypterus blacodes]|uniref:fibronectin type III domain-containing protein 7-like n=1 Tax=Genypterus blacodes TaxID=154954 RepID=UPI003F76A4F8
MCGFTYSVIVIAIDSVCNVSESAIIQLESVPCVPKLIETNVQCESGAVAVSWEQSKGAHYYTVLAQGSGGYESTHNSSKASFVFDQLLCGLSYTITVSASDDSCTSAESNAKQINTVPCIPQRTTAEMLCSTNTGLVSWEEEDSVSGYLVKAAGPDGHMIQCSSSRSSCQLTNMHCGQLYNLTVTPVDDRCDISNAYLNLQSVPCSPTNVKASLQCHSSSIAVTWERASGAFSYDAVAFTSTGHQIQCNNTETFCDLSDLLCGQTYSISVSANDETCESLKSDAAVVQSAPCTPQNVHVEIQCASSSMVVSWSPNPDAERFHVEALSHTGALLKCDTDDTRCIFTNLICGQRYNITVVSVRGGCESKPSPVNVASSAPCVPENAKGSLDCVTNDAWVTWDISEGALSYTVLAEEAGGHQVVCNSSSSTCNVRELKCGTLYTFYVNSINEYCHSIHNTSSFDLETGPCALSSISAVVECHTNTILVEWEKTSNVPFYLVTAEGDDKTIINCNSSSTTCSLEDASCGMHYSIIVSSSSDKCNSLRSPPKSIYTAPCVPKNVTAIPLCEEKGAVVHWAPSTVPTTYHLTAKSFDGHVKTFNTTVNNLNLAELHCSQLYRIDITATTANCTSNPTVVPFRTVPCEPTGLKVDMQCETNSAVVSWDVRPGSVEYIASAESQNGDKLYCESFGTSCTIQGLECGSIYNFTVEGSNGICNTSLSEPLQDGAVPCPPNIVKVRMQRIKNKHWVMISWNPISCPDVEYLAAITGHIQDSPEALMDISSYWLPRPYFEFPIPCSTVYNLTVRSRNAAGAGDPSSLFGGTTVPCPPQNVKYSGSQSMLSWDTSLFATKYTVYSVGADRVELCNTTGLSCTLTNLDPATTEVTASNDVGESIPTSAITASKRRRRDLRDSEIFGTSGIDFSIPAEVTVIVKRTSLHVKWALVGGATQYVVLIEEPQNGKDAEQIYKTVDKLSYVESNLKPGTTYSVRVAAKNTTGQSEYSEPIWITTDALK